MLQKYKMIFSATVARQLRDGCATIARECAAVVRRLCDGCATVKRQSCKQRERRATDNDISDQINIESISNGRNLKNILP